MQKCRQGECDYNVLGQCKYFEWAEFFKWRRSERLKEANDPMCGNPKNFLKGEIS